MVSENLTSWITNIEIKDADMSLRLPCAGRLRWKIENEGFNTQKNLGYNLEHKYNRISFVATRNYCQCMQLAHLIEQLTLMSRQIKELFSKEKTTITKLSERLRNILVINLINEKLLEKTSQIKFG